MEQKAKDIILKAQILKLLPQEAVSLANVIFELLKKLQEFEKEKKEILDKFDNTVEKIKESVPDLSKLLKNIKGIPGEPGHTPTDEELLDLIRPLIPEIKDGQTPTTEELLNLIKPLIPKVKDGQTPSDERLISLIEPLIPKPIPGKDADETLIIEKIENNLPSLGEKIRDGLELLKDEERLKISAIDKLEEELEELRRKPTRVGGGGFSYIAMNQHFIDDETPTGTINGTNKVFTIALTPNPTSSLKVFVNGQRMRLTEDYTFSGVTITFLTAPPTGSVILCDYRN